MRAWFREERQKQGLTLKDMGKKLGCTEGYVCLIESGTRKGKIDLPFAVQLGKIFNLSLCEIAKKEGLL